MRILWIKTSPLHPLTRGGDLRTYHLLRWLNQWHDVTFAGMVADPGQRDATGKADLYSKSAHWTDEPKVTQSPNRLAFLFGALMNVISPLPYAVQRFASTRWSDQIAALLKENEFDVVICDFIFPAASLPWSLHEDGTPWVVFQHNVESMIWKRRATEAVGPGKPYLLSQWRRMERFESAMCRRFDAVLTVSEEDSKTSEELYQLTNVMGAIPTGVDLDYFTELPRRLPATPTLVFVGSMDWYANVDAIEFFFDEIWSLVKEKLPSIRIQIVGRNPPERIRSFHDLELGVEVTGTVPDVRPYMREAHAMVVPLRIGGGTRLKVFEAMAAEVPLVSTTIGAEGLEVTDGKHLLLADTAEEFANAICRLIEHPDFADEIATTARREVAEKHSWEKAARKMEGHLLKLSSKNA